MKYLALFPAGFAAILFLFDDFAKSPPEPYTGLPPLIQTTALRYEQGQYCTPGELERLSHYIETHPEEWNAWCDSRHPINF